MVDQNPQVNQNVNNQNESDELFWWSDDIFENSDLLQPINSEVDTTHQVIKSQNDLNDFSGEINNNVGQQTDNQSDIKKEEFNDIQESSDDLFESKPQENTELNNDFDNLYNENWDIESKSLENTYSDNDNIFEWTTSDDFGDIPDIEDIADISGSTLSDWEKPSEENENNLKWTSSEKIEDIPDVEDISKNWEHENFEEISNNPQKSDTQESLDSHAGENIEKVNNLNDTNDKNFETNNKKDELSDSDDINDDLDEMNSWEEWFDDIDNSDIDDNDIDDNDIDDNDIDDEDESYENNTRWEVDLDEDDEEHESNIENSKTNNDIEENNVGWVVDDLQEKEEDTKEDDIENIVVQDYEKYDPKQFRTDVQKKFWELQWKTEKIHELVWKDQDVWFDLLWWNDDRQKTIYKILSGSDYVEIEKEEFNKEDESTISNLLEFVLDEDGEQNLSLQVFVNEIELYDEFRDLEKDPNKKMQVMEKMNKFIFLLDEEYKKIQKYKKEKEERNAVKWVFRNF